MGGGGAGVDCGCAERADVGVGPGKVAKFGHEELTREEFEEVESGWDGALGRRVMEKADGSEMTWAKAERAKVKGANGDAK